MNLRGFHKALITCMLGFMLQPAMASTDSALPHVFKIRIGGFFGPSYSVELKDGSLVYAATIAGKSQKPDIIVPTAAQWQAFRNVLDQLGAWTWQGQYENPGVHDGTQWSIRIEYGNARLESFGSNNYPGAGGTPSPEFTPEFSAYCQAVQALLGGKAFQ